eukprot:758823-Hanusia_phi.AAC.7
MRVRLARRYNASAPPRYTSRSTPGRRSMAENGRRFPGAAALAVVSCPLLVGCRMATGFQDSKMGVGKCHRDSIRSNHKGS